MVIAPLLAPVGISVVTAVEILTDVGSVIVKLVTA